MSLVRLIHWKAEETAVRAARVRAAGHRCNARPFGPRYGEEVRKTPPDIYLIDLSRLPSHGREAGLYLRQSKRQGHVPVVFVDGAPDKVAKVREALPDAIFCTWRGIAGALTRASKQRLEPRRPAPACASGAGKPLWEKLGARAPGVLALAGAPRGLAGRLFADLPAGLELRPRGAAGRAMTVWFVRSQAELEQGLPTKRRHAGEGGLWVAWPKQSSPLAGELARDFIRARLLADGLVDIKVCAIDQDWSGMRFAFPQS